MFWILFAVIGFLGGLVGGLFGVGGGIVFVPLLILLYGYNPHLAIGTSVAAIVPTALMSAWRHALGGMIQWRTVLLLAAFAMIGAWAGAEISLKMPVGLLRRVYAIFLFMLSLKLFFQK